MATQIQLRRDTAANWTSNNPTLAAGEFAWESDTNKFKIGDGTTAWNSLAYASDGDTAGITFVGDDSTGTLVAQNETFKIAGTQNITTAVSGDTLTITGPDLTGYSTFSGSYTDLTNKPTIPTNNNELTNGAGYITASSTDTLTNKSGNISQFTNDSGYKTAVSQADVTQHQAALSITESQISDLTHFSGSYTDLTNKPTIPSAVSELTNDSGFISNSQTTIVGDDSTGTTINSGETFKIAGTQNVSTAVSGDTLTITGPDLSSYATTSYVDTEVAGLVDTAPEALNTLNELAAALGDDANFATTTSTALGNRLRVDTDAQGLTTTQKTNAKTNLGLSTVASTGAYSDLSGTPTIPSNNNELTNGAGYITASSTDTLTNKSGNISQFTNDSGYLTSFTETNDLSSAVTWANVPDANITQSSVTQHQAALSITQSQIADLGAYITDANITIVGDDSTGTSFSAKNNDNIKITGTQNTSVAVSGDTITITGPDLSSYSTFSGSYTDLTNKPTIPTNNTELTNGAGYITASSTDTLTNKSGNISQFTNDAGYKTAVSQADVTQHQAALSITESQISDLSHFSGSYTDLTNKPTIPTNNNQLTNGAGYITDANITIVGDDSTGTSFSAKNNDNIKITGTQNTTVSVVGDTITVTGPDLSSYASTSYVDTAIANTIDSAPETLNTLNELAAALGDDANFATTTSTALGNRLRVDTAAQGLTSTQKSNATTNLGLATVATSGAYSDLSGTPTIPTNNNTLTNGAGYITASSTDTLTNKSGNISQWTNDSGYLTSQTSHADVVVDGDFGSQGIMLRGATAGSYSILTDNSSNWNTAYGWGDHASAGYTTASSTTTFTNKSGNISQWTNDSGYSTFSGSYNDLSDKPTIPSALTDLSISDGTNGQVLTTDGAGNFSFTTVSGGSSTGDFTFSGNEMSTSSSNADAVISASGTGIIQLGSNIKNDGLAAGIWNFTGATDKGTTRSYATTKDFSTMNSFPDMLYPNADLVAITMSGSGDGADYERVRKMSGIQIDSKGYSTSNNPPNMDSITNYAPTEIINTSGTASTHTQMTGLIGLSKVGSGNTTGNITVTDATGLSGQVIVAGGSGTSSITNAYGVSSGINQISSGSITNFYGLYVDDQGSADITNPYGIYVKDSSYDNRIGNLSLQSNTISSLSGTNGNIAITPDGTGKVVIDGLSWPTADGTNGQVLTTDGAGNLSFTTVSGGAASTGDFTFTGNKMTTSSSNADAEIEASGTGRIYIKARGGLPGADYQSKASWSDGRATNANIMFYDDQAATAGSRRMYGNWLLSNYKLDGTNSSSGNARFRHQSEIYMDLNGTSLTNNGDSRGLQFSHQNIINNSSATTANLSTTTGFSTVAGWVNNPTGSVNIDRVYGGQFYGAEYAGTADGTITTDYGIVVRPSYKYGPSGSLTITNGYGVYYTNQDWANQTYTNPPYFLYTDKDSVKSNPGALNKFNEWSYNATHSSGAGYTIDWNNGNLQTVTLTSNITSFTMSNFPTSTTQSVGVTLYLVQDGTGGRTMTFSAGSGETFKFANGTNSSSVSSANDIQVVYIFSKYNGSSNTYYWTIGPAYS